MKFSRLSLLTNTVSLITATYVQSSTIDFALCLGATASDKLAARTRVKNGQTLAPLDKKDEIVANVILRFLELRGCVRRILTKSQ